MKQLFNVFLICIIFITKCLAQNETGIVVKDEFFNNTPLNQILGELKTKHKIDLVYDEALVKKYRLSYWFDNVKLEKGMKELLKDTDLKFYVDENNIINIVPRNQVVVLSNAPGKNAFKGSPEKRNFDLVGKIIDAASGEALPFASVSIVGQAAGGTQTNVDGLFTLLKVPSDTSSIIFRYIGYKGITYHLTPKTDLTKFVVELEVASNELDEVVVTGQKTEVMKANEIVGMFKMTPKNIAILPNAGERDIFRAFQLMPGVSAANESSSGLYVRGGTPDQTLVLYDGFTVYHVDHLFGFFSAFNYNSIKDVQLYKGGFESKFGGRISGVAEITGKDGNSREMNVGADISLLSLNAWVEGPINAEKWGDKLTGIFTIRRSYEGPVYNAIFKKFRSETTTQNFGGGGRAFASAAQTPSSYFYDLNGRVTYRPSKKDVITFSIYNGIDNMDNSRTLAVPSAIAGSGFTPPNVYDVSEWGNTGTSLKHSRKWSDKFYTNTLISYSKYFIDRDFSTTFTLPIRIATADRTSIKTGTLESNDLNDFSFKTDGEIQLAPTNKLNIGLQATVYNIAYDFAQNDTVSILSKSDKSSLASLYLDDRLSFLDNKLNLKLGLRGTYFGATSKMYVEPRLSATYDISKRFKLKGAWGQYYQFVKRVSKEDLLQGTSEFWLLANSTNLPVAASTHLIGGISYETPDFLIDVEAYQKKNTGVTEYTLRFDPAPGRTVNATENFFNGSEVVRGIDILLQKKFGDYKGWIGYTLSEVVRDVPGLSDKQFYAYNDVRNEFKIVNSYKYKHWDFAATFIFASGKPYTAIQGTYKTTVLDGSTKTFTTISGKNTERLPDYHRLDISATYNFSHVSIGLSLFNLYNRNNVWKKNYDTSTGVLLETNVLYLGLLPNLTFSWRLH